LYYVGSQCKEFLLHCFNADAFGFGKEFLQLHCGYGFSLLDGPAAGLWQDENGIVFSVADRLGMLTLQRYIIKLETESSLLKIIGYRPTIKNFFTFEGVVLI
jgi:hypothetical protein